MQALVAWRPVVNTVGLLGDIVHLFHRGLAQRPANGLQEVFVEVRPLRSPARVRAATPYRRAPVPRQPPARSPPP